MSYSGIVQTVATMTNAEPRPAELKARTVRVWCVTPWHSRADEVEALLRDLTELEIDGELATGERISLRVRVIVVDNMSDEVVRLPHTASETAADADKGVTFESMRLEENAGGSGGFNAGISRAIEECGADDAGYVWLVDSDARVTPAALLRLVSVLEERADLAAAGSAIGDPETGRVFEVGAMIDRRSGALRPACEGSRGARSVVECDYVASCSSLVRLAAVRACGPMPNLFLHGDDAAWFIRMKRITGKRVAGVASSVVYHPRFDRFAVRGRYYAARNGFAPLDELSLGRCAVTRRAMREVGRAVQQEMMGRSDLARLHVQGLRDAAKGITGAGAGLSAKIEPFRPLSELGEALKPLLGEVGAWHAIVGSEKSLGLSDKAYAQLCAEIGRAGVHVASDGRRPAWRVVNAGAKGMGLLRGAGLIEVAPGVRGGGREPGFVIRTGDRVMTVWRASHTACAATWQAMRVVRKWSPERDVQDVMPRRAVCDDRDAGTAALTLSIVVVSYNRWHALRGTLQRLQSMAETGGAEVIVVDNASTDGSADNVAREFPDVMLIREAINGGVSAFNRGAERARGDVVLVLDDDSWPDAGAVEKALNVLSGDSSIAGVSLHPRHPATGRGEWRSAAAIVDGARSDWPIMGCGNLVRRSAWHEVGGYEEKFFLYRNDVDLALKLLAAGWGVHFDPALTVWHDSPAAARKSVRWHRTATRNWIWLAKRHGGGTGFDGALGAAIGWLWAHKLAGLSASRQWATLRGGIEGLARRAPAIKGNRERVFGKLVRMLMARG